MKTSYAAAITLALATLTAGYAVAGETPAPGKTRDQVRAELAQAKRTGDIMSYTYLKNLNEVYPDRYPPVAAVPSNTRDQVLTELAQAKRTGDIMSYTYQKNLNELYPDRYPATAKAPGMSTAQVQAELREAQRTGNFPASGDAQ